MFVPRMNQNFTYAIERHTRTHHLPLPRFSPFNQSLKPVSQQVSQTVSQPVSQTSLLTSLSTNLSTSLSNQSLKPVSQPISQPISQPVSQPSPKLLSATPHRGFSFTAISKYAVASSFRFRPFKVMAWLLAMANFSFSGTSASAFSWWGSAS